MATSLPSARAGRFLRAANHTQVVWTDLAGMEHYHRADRRVRSQLPANGVGMRRIGHQHAGAPLQREHYSATMGRHVWCESGLEELAMLLADRARSIEAYACQAIEFVWPMDCPQRSHVVDLICWKSDDEIELVDIHPGDDDDFCIQADLTQAACSQVGWTYRVFAGLDDMHARNVRWMAADRHWWVVAGRGDLLGRVVDLAAQPISISRLCELADPDVPAVARPVVHYAIWHGLLEIDWHVHWTGNTVVWAGTGEQVA